MGDRMSLSTRHSDTRNPWAALGWWVLILGGGVAWGVTVAYLYARRWA